MVDTLAHQALIRQKYPLEQASSLLGGVAARISQRCMYIFKLFPIESTACLSKFAKQVAQQLVVPAKGFRSARKDHNNLLNSDAMSWHKEVFSHSSHSRSSSSQFASFGGKEDTPYAWCAHPDLAASEHHAKVNPPPPTGASFSRILAAICVIVNHAYEELEYGHLSKLQSLSTVSGGAGGGDFRPDATPASTVLQMMLDLDFNDVILPPATKLVQTTMLTRFMKSLLM